MKNIHALFILALITLTALPVCAQEEHQDQPQDQQQQQADDDAVQVKHPTVLDKGKVKEILKSDLVMLDNDRRYRLENILIPPFEDQPAIDELKNTFLDKPVTVYTYHDVADTRGIPLTQVIADNNLWVQEDLVSKGLAWAYSTDTSMEMVHALKLVEDDARRKQLGFWRNPVYAIKTPLEVKKFMNSYQIVEGKILSVNAKSYSATTFFNFGKNWKTDFVVRIHGDKGFLDFVKDPQSHDRPKREGDIPAAFDPRKWENRVVRVRGWVHGTSGPVIDLTEKEQIDFVDGDADTAAAAKK